MKHDRRLLRCVAMALLCGVASATLAAPVARADDARAEWLAGRTFEKKETFTTGGKTVEAYAAKHDEAVADAPAGVHLFLVIDGDSVGAAYAATTLPVEGESVRVELAPRSQDPDVENPSIEIAIVPASSAYATARRLLEDTLVVDELWTAAAGLLERAIGEAEPSARRPLALAATRVLDRLYAAHPDHMGLLEDVLTSYQLLLPLEATTDRGANISFLWRDRLRTCIRLRGGADEAADVVARTLSSCGLAEGCCALARIGADFATKHVHAYGEGVVAMLETLGQAQQELTADVPVPTARGDLRVASFRCASEPPDNGVPFHRYSFLTFGPASSGVPTPVWYSLTCERTGERTRWALYGNVGGSRRLLRLFGAAEPDSETVTTLILEQLRAAVDVAEKK